MKRFKPAMFSLALVAVLGLAVVGPAQAAEKHSDATISLAVHVALLGKLGVDAGHVSVNTHAGHVQLAGTVAKRETRELAGDIAKTVAGVVSVKNDIRTQKEITGSDAVSVATKEAELETKDALLASQVRLQLLNKMGTDGFKVHIRVANKVVFLSFSDDLGSAERAKAEQLTRDLEDVKKVIVHN